MSNLTDNTAALNELLAAVNNLPEAGGSSPVETELLVNDQSFETCTVLYSTPEGIRSMTIGGGNSLSVETVIGGDVVVIIPDYWDASPLYVEGLSIVETSPCDIWGTYCTSISFKVTGEYPVVDIILVEST